MTVTAKEIIKDKFWIVENNGEKIATLSLNDNKYMFSDSKGTKFYNDEQNLTKEIGTPISWSKLSITEIPKFEIYNYPTSCAPHNILYDVKKSLPLFTKSIKSKSLYCAGYYIIHFDKGWVKSFCPKLMTIERYQYQGPFKSKIEMKNALGQQNGKNRTN